MSLFIVLMCSCGCKGFCPADSLQQHNPSLVCLWLFAIFIPCHLKGWHTHYSWSGWCRYSSWIFSCAFRLLAQRWDLVEENIAFSPHLLSQTHRFCLSWTSQKENAKPWLHCEESHARWKLTWEGGKEVTSWEGNTRFASSWGVIAPSLHCFFAKRKEGLELMWFQPIWSPKRLELEQQQHLVSFAKGSSSWAISSPPPNI